MTRQKYPSDNAPRVQLRLTEELSSKLKESAIRNCRSFNGEALYLIKKGIEAQAVEASHAE